MKFPRLPKIDTEISRSGRNYGNNDDHDDFVYLENNDDDDDDDDDNDNIDAHRRINFPPSFPHLQDILRLPQRSRFSRHSVLKQ